MSVLQLRTSRSMRGFEDRKVRTIVLACIYGHGWVSIAPYTLLAYVRKFDIATDFRIICREFNIEDSTERIVEQINAEKPDVVGFSTYVFTVQRTLEVVSQLACMVMLGGPQVAKSEDELLRDNPNIDLLVTGDGERAFKMLLEHFRGLRKLEDVPGITTRDGKTPQLPDTLDLDEIPPIYPQLLEDHPHVERVTVETQRGCPYACRFCAWSDSQKMRYRNLDNVLRDFSLINSRPNITYVYLADSSLFLRKKRAKAVLQHLIDIKCNKGFLYELNLEHVDDELVELMAQLPSQEFSFGIQAVSDQANEAMDRKFDRQLWKTNYDKIARRMARPQLSVDLIYPLPGDTLDGFKESIDYALSLDRLQNLKFNPFILLRGAPFYERQEEFGIKMRDGDPFQVGECDSFPAADVELARRYAFYAIVVFYTHWLKDSCQLVARKRNASLIDTVIELFESLPVDLLEGEAPPEMLLADPRRNRQQMRQHDRIAAVLTTKREVIVAHLWKWAGEDPDVGAVLTHWFGPHWQGGRRTLDRPRATVTPRAPERVVQDMTRVGRNDPCPCGSGQKYKRCCHARLSVRG